MSERETTCPWLPSSPAISVKCDGCRRGIPEYLFDEEYALESQISEIQTHGTTETWTHCGTCGSEITTFAREVLDMRKDESYEEEQDKERKCGFCDGPLEDDRWDFAFSSSGVDTWESAVLCENCQDVMTNFVEAVPEQTIDGPDPDNDVYYPQILKEDPLPHRPVDVDGSAFVPVFRDLEEDSIVRFEAWRDSDEGVPAQYVQATGQVTQIQDGGLTHPKATIEPAGDVTGFWLRQTTPDEYVLELCVGFYGEEDYLQVSANWDGETYKYRRSPAFAGDLIEFEVIDVDQSDLSE